MQKRKTVLITGSSGFIGRNLAEFLEGKKSYDLLKPSHSQLELLDAEKVSEFIKGSSIDVIVHCASVGGSRKTAYDEGKTDVVAKNLQMFFNLARCLGKARMIHLGSGAEYDRGHCKPRMNEDFFDTHVPEDAYGFSKYVCSKYIEKADNIVCLRPFGVFGKYEDYRFKFISNAIVKNLFEMPIIINQNVFFDYIYIADLVKIIEHFIMNRPKHKFYNVCTGSTIDLLAIAAKINQLAKKPSEIIVNNKGLNAEYSGDNSRLLRELRGFEFTPFEQALQQLFEWHITKLPEINKGEIERDEFIKYCRTRNF